MHGHAAVVKLLLEHKADPTDADFGGLPLLKFAINHPAVVRLLIDAGADPKVRLNYRGNGQGPPEGSTLLHAAATHGQVETAEILLARGVPIDARTNRGHTALHFAALYGHPEMVKFLLTKKASLAGGVGEEAMSGAAGNLSSDDREKAEENARYNRDPA